MRNLINGKKAIRRDFSRSGENETCDMCPLKTNGSIYSPVQSIYVVIDQGMDLISLHEQAQAVLSI